MLGHIDSSSHVRSCLQLAYIQLSFEQIAAHPGFQPCHRRAKLASASPSSSKPSAQEPAPRTYSVSSESALCQHLSLFVFRVVPSHLFALIGVWICSSSVSHSAVESAGAAHEGVALT